MNVVLRNTVNANSASKTNLHKFSDELSHASSYKFMHENIFAVEHTVLYVTLANYISVSL